MNLLRSTVPECAVIGGQQRAIEVKKLLDTSDVPTMVLPHNFGHGGIVNTCVQKGSLKAIAVLCRDFPQDSGAGLFAELRTKLPTIGLHAFLEDAKNEDALRRALGKAGVKEFFFAFPMEPVKIASALKQRWFSARKGDSESPRRGRPPKDSSASGEGVENASSVVEKAKSGEIPAFVSAAIQSQRPVPAQSPPQVVVQAPVVVPLSSAHVGGGG